MKKNLERGEFLKYLRKTMRIMRLSLFLIMISTAMAFSATSYSQNTKLTLDLNNATVKEVIKAIEDQSEFLFFYQEKHVDLNRQVTLHATEQDVETILNQLFAETNNIYVINDRQIVIGVAPRRELEKQILRLKGDIKTVIEQPQQKEITGKVTDTDGLPLPGVSIIVKGTTIGTVTNNDGEFSLNIPLDAETLQFSFVGMHTQEVDVGNQTSINMRMEDETIGLEEVVAIGYGIKEKKNLTGAVDQVDMGKILANRPVSSTAQAIQGTLPGVQVTTNSGRPGEPSSIRIRGVMSITGGSPLVLVDNVPMSIENINPADIENISVLKDASSSAIYGGRAAFGVILITTKKSKKNEPISFNYRTNITTSQPINLPEKLTTKELVDAWQDWGHYTFYNGEDLATWSNLLAEFNSDPSKYPAGETYIDGILYRLTEEDIYKKFMTNSFEQMHNFSFSGGSDRSNYRVSFGFADEDGIMITDKDSYKKYNVNAYLNTELTNNLVSSTNILYHNSDRSTPNNYSMLFYQGLTLGNHTSTGFRASEDGTLYPYNTPNNILENEPPDRNFKEDLRFFEKLEYNLLNDLNLIGEYTYNKMNSSTIVSQTENMYWDAISESPVPITYRNPARAESGYNRSFGTTDYHALNIYADYSKVYNDHKIDILIGTNQELRKYSGFWADRATLLNFELPSLATASGTQTVGESFNDYSISGYFGRLDYSFKNKYLVESNIRYDGSSKFPQKSRFGFFPSVSLGWVLSEESFFEPIKSVIDFMKIRGSYGEIGNQDISNYAYIPGMTPYVSSWINPGSNLRHLTIGTPALVSSSFTWETVATRNIGIDVSLFDQRLSATFDYYNRQTHDMLGAASELPAVIGASAPQKNVADLESKGWELRVDWRVDENDFGYSIGFNLSDNRAFVTKFKNEAGLLSQYYEGYEFGQIWGLVTDRFFTVDDFEPGSLDENLMNGTLREGIVGPYYSVINPNPGDIKYVDLDDSGRIDYGNSTLSNPGDRKIIGNDNRRYQFGVVGNGYYKKFDFSFLIQGVGKRDLWLSNQLMWPHLGFYSGVYSHTLDYWTPDNTETFYPRVYPSGGGNYSYSRLTQTKYLTNGAYLTLKNIEIGYNFEGSLTEQLTFLNKIRLFLSAENLLRLDHVPSGVDPELAIVSGGGIYPQLRKFSVGLNVSF